MNKTRMEALPLAVAWRHRRLRYRDRTQGDPLTAAEPTAAPMPHDSAGFELTGDTVPVRTLLRDVVRQADLLPMLASKDYRARYRSASMGLAWSAFLPMLQGAVLAVVFTQVVRIPTDVSYPVYILSGVATWSYFSQSLTTGSTALVDNGGLAGRVYFPRLLLPAVTALANIVSFGITLAVVLVLMRVFDVDYRWTLLLLPVAVLVAFVLTVTLSAILAIAHVYFRDVRYIVSAGVMVLFYATPVIYPPDLAGDLRWLLDLHPATGMVMLVRWTIFPDETSLGWSLVSTGVWIVGLTIATLLVFRRQERIAMDRL